MEAAPTDTDDTATPRPQSEAAEALLAQATTEVEAAARELAGAVERAESAQRAHRAAEGLADAVLAVTERPIVVLDAELRVVGWSAGAEAAWSLSAGDALGRRWSRAARSIDPSTSTGDLEELITKGSTEAMVPLGSSLQVRILGEGELVRHLIVTTTGR